MPKKECKFCKNIFMAKSSSHNFCSVPCSNRFQTIKKIDHWLENPGEYSNILYKPDPRLIKPILMEEQKNKCKICEIENFWNNKPMNFVLDHIDGNAANNRRENLRLICHNCDSQLSTYKSKNKNSARTSRYKNKNAG